MSNKKLYAYEILELCFDIHHNSDDFEEGDITERIYKEQEYELTTVCPLFIDQEWDIAEDLVLKYMAINPSSVPPVVLLKYSSDHFSIVDGSHRIEVFKRLGISSIPTYIGKVI